MRSDVGTDTTVCFPPGLSPELAACEHRREFNARAVACRLLLRRWFDREGRGAKWMADRTRAVASVSVVCVFLCVTGNREGESTCVLLETAER